MVILVHGIDSITELMIPCFVIGFFVPSPSAPLSISFARQIHDFPRGLGPTTFSLEAAADWGLSIGDTWEYGGKFLKPSCACMR